MAAVHRLEDAVAAGLHGQVQERHERGEVAVRLNETLRHVIGMAGRVTDARQAGDAVERIGKAVEPLLAASLILARPRVDVLPDQRDLASAGIDQRARLVEDGAPRAADFRPARIGHDAIGAELVAAFLHGEEGGRAGAAGAAGQRLELGGGGHVRIHRRAASHGIVDEAGQAMISLRADDDVDGAGAAADLGPLGLCDAAGDGDHRPRAILAGEPANLRIDLLGRLLADVAGVEHDKIGIEAFAHGTHAALLKKLGHALAVIDVHLAAVGLDVERLGLPVGRGLAHARAL